MVTHNMLRTQKEKYVFLEKKNQFVSALDVSTCLEQVEIAPYVRTS